MDKKFRISWRNIEYTINNNWLQRKLLYFQGQKNVIASKKILNSVNGRFNSGEMTAFMGPSGAGKSTLMEILVGIRKKGKTGNIFFEGTSATIDLAFIPQNDVYFEDLTVRETLLFASKLKNTTKAKWEQNTDLLDAMKRKSYHKLIVNHVATVLGLDGVMDTYARNLSGGQRKRLSVAQELVSMPDILVLDEPTSGLDSTTALKCIQLLQSVSRQSPPVTVVCTIHQPNPETFNLFDRVYILSAIGKCIYEGSPLNIVKYLKKVDVECPMFYNPADFIIELAAGEKGIATVEKLAALHESDETLLALTVDRKLKKVIIKPNYPFISNFLTLSHRCFLNTIRNKSLMILRFFTHFGFAFFLCYLFGTEVGKATGCPPINDTISVENSQNAVRVAMHEVKRLTENMSLILISVLMVLFGSMLPSVISTPTDIQKALKEKRNHWYGIGSLHLSLVLIDLPFQLFFSFSYLTIIYVLTEQAPDLWRYNSLLFIFISMAILGYSLGMIAGTIFMYNIHAAVMFGPMSALTLILFSGLVIRIPVMPYVLQQISRFNFLRFASEAVIIILYGFGRCDDSNADRVIAMKQRLSSMIFNLLNIVDKEIKSVDDDYDYSSERNDTQPNQVKEMTDAIVGAVMAGAGVRYTDESGNPQSHMLGFFNLYDEYLYICFAVLTINIVINRLLAFVIMIWKAKL